MKKKVLSLFLILCLVASMSPNIVAFADIIDDNSQGNIENKINNEASEVIPLKSETDSKNSCESDKRVKEALDKLRNYYSGQKELDYLEAMAYRHSSEEPDKDKKFILNKLTPYNNTRNAIICYKGIMEVIAGGGDPTNYTIEEKPLNYISGLLKQFNTVKGTFQSQNDVHSNCILALDMGKYDYEDKKQLAIKALIGPNIERYKKMDKAPIILTALANHRDIDGVQDAIVEFKNYIKSQQKEAGGFDGTSTSNSAPVIIGSVIQALIALGEDPLSEEWTKNGKTMLDTLMSFQKVDDGTFFSDMYSSSTHTNSTSAAFAALADLYRHKSMYQGFDEGIVKEQNPKSIEVILSGQVINGPINMKIGKSKEFSAEVKDEVGDKITKVDVQWNIVEGDCVSIQNGTVTASKEGTAKIQASFKGIKSAEIIINVQPITPASIKISLPEKTELIMGENFQLNAKILDEDGDEINGQRINWDVDKKNIANIINSNQLDTSTTDGGIVKVKAVLDGNEGIKDEVNIKVLKPTSINILMDGKVAMDNIAVKVGIDTVLVSQIKDQDNQAIERAETTWTVSEGSCVTVTNGKISAISEGIAKIKAEYKGLQKEITINSEKIKPEELKIEDIINLLKSQTVLNKNYNYMEALTLSYIDEDKNNIARKLDFNKYASTPKDCAQSIIMLIAAGFNPYDYEGKNYVKQLVDKQDLSQGYFDKNLSKNFDHIVIPIIALDMAGADYDKAKAINYMKDTFFKIAENQSYIKETVSSNDHDLGKTTMALIALSDHRDMDGINDLIKTCINYVKKQQNEKGYFEKAIFDYDWESNETTETREASCELTAKVIQALYALGESPLSDEWSKNVEGEKRTLLDSLMTFKYGNQFKENKNSDKNHDAIDATFAALVEINKGKSIYKELKYGSGVPSKIEIINTDFNIKKGNKLQFITKVLDSKGKEIPNIKLIWNSDNLELARVDEGLLKALKSGKVKITVSVEGYKDVKSLVEVNIGEAVPSIINIAFPISINKLETNNPIKLDVVVKDQVGEKLELCGIEWILNLDGTTIDENGFLKCSKAGKLEIIAKIKGTDIKSNPLCIDVVQQPNSYSEIIKVLKELRKNYLKQEEYSYLEVVAVNFAGVNKNIIANKKLKDVTDYDALHCKAKSIMSIKAAGKDPLNYNGENYVDRILKPKDLNYKFYNETSVKDIAMAILALDMVKADYNKEEAIKSLIKKAYVTDTMAYYGEAPNYDVNTTSIVMIAMAGHKDIKGVNEFIEKCKMHFKSVQLQSGGFNNSLGCESSIDTGAVIQALIAVGDDPLTYQWSKIHNNAKKVTMFDAILNYRKEIESNKDVIDPSKDITIAVFAALVDLKFQKSMYQYIGNNHIEPIRIEIISPSSNGCIYIDEKLQLTTKIYDDIDNDITDKKIIWECNNSNSVEINESGLIIGKVIGTAVITAKIEDMGNVIKSYTVIVKKPGSNKDIIISRVGNDSIKNGRDGNLKINVKNSSSDEREITVALVVYDKATEKMIKCSYVTKNIEGNNDEIINGGFNIPKEGNYIVKAFVCKNLTEIETDDEPLVAVDVEK